MDARVPLRLLWRDWKGGELSLLVAALIIAVSTVSAIAIFVDRLQQALVVESSAFLAADRVVRGSRPISAEWEQAALDLGLDTARTLTFSSMLFGPERSQLVSVKAVSSGYPLRGSLQIADAPFTAGRDTHDLPGPGEVWLDGRLLPALDVDLGDRVEVGNAIFDVSRILTREPDRGGSFFDLGPRVLMPYADVEATGVIQPGSRLSYALLLRGSESALESWRDQIGNDLNPHFEWVDIRTGSDAIGRALARGESFLLLGGLLAVILSGVAVALAAHRYSQRQHDPVAVLKTLGMTPSEIQHTYLSSLLLLGAFATSVGLLAGWGVQSIGLIALSDLVPVVLPAPGLRPFLVGGITGFICLLAFALPPLLRLRGVSPLRVIRRDLAPNDASMAFAYLSGLAGSLILLVWYADSLQLAGWLILGTFGTVVVLLGVAYLLLRTGRILGMQAGSSWRIALAALQRRRRENSVQIVVFGIAIMLLLILYLLRTALLEEWRGQMPEDAPNHFVLNIAPDEVAPLTAMLDEHATGADTFYPMMRGRIVAVNGSPTVDSESDQRSRVGSERNLSWTWQLPPGNRIVAGQWWLEGETEPQVSLDADFAESVGLGVGDHLVFDIVDRQVEARVASLRSVDWDSMRPNFFILATPAMMEDLPATWLTSFRLEAAEKQFLTSLLRRFPTLSVIEIDEVMAQVQRIVERVTLAVEVVLILVLLAGALVLIASIQSSMDERFREFGLLRALGAGQRRILGALVIEFAALGLFAGILASVGAEVTVWILQEQIFQLPGRLHPGLWIGGPVLGVLLIGSIGTISTYKVVRTPPAIVLRETG
ncbi:MAG: FtsX-like permease family protein [Gammaproteobacteria bacterium]|nr:MAG: FtsX-like permease family protein [Gammaproteobacteria bacterium]